MRIWLLLLLALACCAQAQVEGADLLEDGMRLEALAPLLAPLPLTEEDIEIFEELTERLVVWIPDHMEEFRGAGRNQELPLDAISGWEVWGEEDGERARDWFAAYFKIMIARDMPLPIEVESLPENRELVATFRERIEISEGRFQQVVMGERVEPLRTPVERAATRLKSLVGAQARHFEEDTDGDGVFDFARDLRALSELGLIHNELHDGECDGYRFTLVASADDWLATAAPLDGEGTFLFVDRSGVVRSAEGRPARVSSPPLAEQPEEPAPADAQVDEAPRPVARLGGASEASAISSMRTLVSAQAIFHQGDLDGDGDNDYGQLGELAANGVIDNVLGKGKKSGYSFALAVTVDGWECVATPDDPGLRSFFVDETGVIRFEIGQSVGPDSPPVR